jgi:glucose-6-phosphate isomerase/transaldolase/glucose-6-phosphate isomerase
MTDRYHLGDYSQLVANAAAKLDFENVAARLRAHDHTLWSDETAEISDRLAWLTLPTDIRPELTELSEFAHEVRSAGYQHVVLLGMGGSSLGPEVIRQVIGCGSAEATSPRMLTLDSTVPDWVAATAGSIDPARTLFAVSSKSGTTTEPLTFYAYFRDLADAALGVEAAGDNFIAVTDPGTPLAKKAVEENFRRAFLNNPEIGGRYSVLSYFGLVPAALTGVNLDRLVASAERMQWRCLADRPLSENPGALLGVTIGTMVRKGKDKLTLIASEGIEAFGLWVEQLLAESTGKDGTGVVPVATEPLADAESGYYGNDRFFVQLRLGTDDNAAPDRLVENLRTSGHPVIVLELADAYDLGAEFYRWEYATAVVGHVLGIHPFDQPDVQGAKDRTISVLDQWQRKGRLPSARADEPSQLAQLLDDSQPGDYLAIMAYLPDTDAIRESVHELRRRVMAKYRVATTMGYGPRYLHSTGQLHKGGPASGIFLQLTQDHTSDIAIPGWDLSFGVLADAQALGDLQALNDLGRRTVSLNLGSDPTSGIKSLVDAL